MPVPQSSTDSHKGDTRGHDISIFDFLRRGGEKRENTQDKYAHGVIGKYYITFKKLNMPNHKKRHKTSSEDQKGR